MRSVFFSLILLLIALPACGQSSVLDLNDSLQKRKQEQKEIQEKIELYQNKINSTQKKAKTLQNQISIIDSGIYKSELEIKNKEIEAEQLALEAQLVEQQILKEERRALETRLDIAKVLREVEKFDNRKYVEIILAEDSFSQVFDQLFYTEKLAYNLKEKIKTIQSVKGILGNNKKQLESNVESAKEKQQQLNILVDSLAYEKSAKSDLIKQTKASESEFKKMVSELQSAASSIDSDIVTIESAIRKKLDISDKLAGDTGILSWPINPLGGISATFHDPTYPYRYLFEHTGIDIRAKQGTAVRAPASGYVAQVYNGGYGIKPSYVMILHGNDLTTVFMHLSQINVKTDTFVARGDVIGLTGGAPGTIGAGRWSTGPHLHLETRIKGVPVNPMGYLP